MPRPSIPKPFFYFDRSNAHAGPKGLVESDVAFFRRLDTRDGQLLRGLLNRCWERYAGNVRKLRDMAARLECGEDRVQAGVMGELLVSEILARIYAQVEVEPVFGGVTPDFRAYDDIQKPVIVEVTHYMETSDETHAAALRWEAMVADLRPALAPTPTLVTLRPIGSPPRSPLGEKDVERLRSAVLRSARTGEEVTVFLGPEFSIAVEATEDSRWAVTDTLVWGRDEHPGGIIDVGKKLRRIAEIVKAKADKSYVRKWVTAGEGVAYRGSNEPSTSPRRSDTP